MKVIGVFLALMPFLVLAMGEIQERNSIMQQATEFVKNGLENLKERVEGFQTGASPLINKMKKRAKSLWEDALDKCKLVVNKAKEAYNNRTTNHHDTELADTESGKGDGENFLGENLQFDEETMQKLKQMLESLGANMGMGSEEGEEGQAAEESKEAQDSEHEKEAKAEL